MTTLPADRDAPREMGRANLERERSMEIDELWDAYEAELDLPLSAGMNMAHEICDRWAADRARLGLIVRHPAREPERWTFAELMEASSRLASALSSLGLRRGDRVAALVTRQVEAWIAALAVWRAGLVYVPLFVGFGPDALAQRLNAAGAAAVFVDHQYRDVLAAAGALLDDDPAVITIAGTRGQGIRRGDLSFWAEVETGSPEFENVATAADEVATIEFTSGTTGPPKGCVLTHSTVVAVQPFVRHTFALRPSDMFFTSADPGWAYGLYTTGAVVWSLGCPRVMYTGDFDPAAWLGVIEAERVTYLSGAPSAYRRLAEVAKRQGGLPTSVRGATSAGEPLDAPLAQAWRELAGHDLQDGYGQTELSMVLANLCDDDKPILPGALASVVPGFEVALRDSQGNQSTDGEGVLHVRRPRHQTACGYWKQNDLWAARWKGEWFSTGDRFRHDTAGYWWFLGRDDDLIVTSGYNVGPSEIENVILDHQNVADVAVVAADDPARGKVVRAVVVRRGDVTEAQLTKELKAMVRERVGRHAYPRIVDFVAELPRTETGKLRRAELRK